MDICCQHGLKYETAWTWLHKLRSWMAQFGRAPLSGSVELDETYLGGENDDAHKGRSLSGWRGEAMGRIRLVAVLNATALALCGAHVKTDGLRLLERAFLGGGLREADTSTAMSLCNGASV